MSRKYLTPDGAAVLNNMNPISQNSKLGDNLKYLLDNVGVTGIAVYLDPENGNDANDGFSPDSAKKTLQVAYSVLRENRNDVLYYMANNGSIILEDAFDWNKDYTHFIGICSPVGVAKRARIFQLSTATGIDLVTCSASGCMWKNIYVFQGVDDATSKLCMTLAGSRNYFENVHFAGIGHATMSVAGSASLKLDGAEENLFYNCQIGLDTISRDADATEILLDGGCTRNVFKECLIFGYTSAAGYSQVTLEDSQAIDRYMIFEDCMFLTDSLNKAITQTQVFNIKEAMAQGQIILKNSFAKTDGGAATWDANGRGIIWNNSVAAAASAGGGIMTGL